MTDSYDCSPLIMQRLNTVYPTDIYSRTFNVTPNK